MLRILIVDDHPLIRDSVRTLLELEADLVVIGEAASSEDALDELDKKAPDVVLIDVALPGMSGIDLAVTIRQRFPDLLCCMLSGHGEKMYVDRALAAGASGYILKDDANQLAGAIRHVARGERYLSSQLQQR